MRSICSGHGRRKSEQVPENPLPPLDPFDLRMLRESIRDHGVREPIVKDEFDEIIDGHHRARIAAEFGADCPERIVSGLTAEEKRSFALTLNAARRQLTIDQKREVWDQGRTTIAAALRADPTQSDRAVAQMAGTHHMTVAKVRDELEMNGDISKVERRGRSEPKEIPAENNADHRNEVYIKTEIGYACESDEVRMRGNKPYPKASERLTWHSGQLPLTCSAPRNEQEAAAMLAEGFQRVSREMSSRPLKTMARQLV